MFRFVEVKPLFIRALEVGSGGKLMNLVVDSDEIAKTLLTKRCFDFFVVYITLNKIVPPRIKEELIEHAQRVAKKHGSKLYLPYSPDVCKPIDPKYSAALHYCLGGFVIVDNEDAAAEISEIGLKAVTLDGDSFDPSGQIAGGHLGNNVSLFGKYQRYMEIKKHFEAGLKGTNKLELSETLAQMIAKKEDYLREKTDLVLLAEKQEKLKNKAQQFRLQGNPGQIEEEKNKLAMYKAKVKRAEEDINRVKHEIKANTELIVGLKKGGDAKLVLGNKLKQLQAQEEMINRSYKENLTKKSEAEASVEKYKYELKSLEDRMIDEEGMVVRLKVTVADRGKFVNSQVNELMALQVATFDPERLAGFKR